MTDIRQRLLAAFAIEHREHLAAMRSMLDALPAGGIPDISEMHRRAHSLKGAARAVDLPAVVAIAHGLEDLLSEVQENRRAWTAAAAQTIRRALGDIEDQVATAFAMPPAVETAPGAATPSPERAAPPRPAETDADSPFAGLVRVQGSLLERLLETAGGLLPELEAQAAVGSRLRQLHSEAETLAGQPRADALAGRLHRLVGQVEEAWREHRLSMLRLRQAAGRLHDDIRGLRMVPADDVLAGLGQTVRNAARVTGKQVEVDVAGLDTEADRLVLQALKDPLLHLLRNAVAHGIEPPDERLAAGKPAIGRVRVSLSSDGGRLQVAVADDGRGIDLRAVARVAAARGLLPQGEADVASPETVRDLIFEPGFSTSLVPNEVSGRGMGLSVVRREIQRLQGQVQVLESGLDGTGVAFALSVPQSLSAQSVLLVAAGGEVLALPTSQGVRCRPAAGVPMAVVEGRSLVELDGERMPVMRLASVLDLPSAGGEDRPAKLVVLGPAGRQLAILVDEVLAVKASLVQRADRLRLDPTRWDGILLLDDGSPCLVLQPAWLQEQAGRPGLMPLAAPGPPRRPPRVLIVDDSITTRTLERSILEAHGYQVQVAMDGAEGLDLLQAGEVDVVVSDIEMPRMDGFALLKLVRGSQALANLPFILVTSRDDPADRERGLHLGADAYIVKSRFDQDDLLEAIRRLT